LDFSVDVSLAKRSIRQLVDRAISLIKDQPPTPSRLPSVQDRSFRMVAAASAIAVAVIQAGSRERRQARAVDS